MTKIMKYNLEYKFSDFTNLISMNGPKYVNKWPREELVETVMQVIHMLSHGVARYFAKSRHLIMTIWSHLHKWIQNRK